MSCWLCMRPVYTGYLNPFETGSELCAECHRCVEDTFDEERPSSARLFHELSRKSGLSTLQLEESWIDFRVQAMEKVEAAAHVEGKINFFNQRKSELSMSWEEKPPRQPDFGKLLGSEALLAVYFQANEITQECLIRAGARSSNSDRQYSTLHILDALLVDRQETNAHSILALAGFDSEQSYHDLFIAQNRDVPLRLKEGRRVTKELAEALDQALKFRGHIDWGTRRLLKTILHEESLAHDFLSKRCQMDTLFELLSRAKGLS